MKDYLNTTSYNISWFKKNDDEKFLEMSPPFQRNLVWSIKQKSYLIDSVLGGYPIPELYLQEKVSGDGTTKFILVDGQQRINAVLSFIHGDYSIEPSESEKWGGLYFDDLSEVERVAFYRYKFIIRLLPDISDEEIRSIFQRINKNNVKLNDQELRQSTYSGDFIQSMNIIANKSYWKELALFSAEKVRRMEDVEYISELAIAYLNGTQNKKQKLDFYYQLYEADYPDRKKFEDVSDKVVQEIIQIVPDIQKTRWVKVVDFYTLFLVFADQSEKIPFSRDTRIRLSAALSEFSKEVSSIQRAKEPVGTTTISTLHAANYSKGIRNSSDAGSRRTRFDSLHDYLITIIRVDSDCFAD